MLRYTAFLRAINVGGRVVKMDRLRTLFESLGLANVETFIASGNVLFDTPAANVSSGMLAQKIERELYRALGYEVATFLRTGPELAAVAAHRPFDAPDPLPAGHSLLIGFLNAAPTAAAEQRLMAYTCATDDFSVHGREVYWWCRGRISDSRFTGARLEKALGLPTTMRNVKTVRRLVARQT